jgi:hypothetical protein
MGRSLMLKKVKVKRSAQTTYTLLPERFCTYCGAVGIYEDDMDDYYQGNGTFCFRCSEARPLTLRDAGSLPKLLAGEAVVVDRVEWETEEDELTVAFENYMHKVAASMVEAMLEDGPKGDE